jgi:hypothetical protein
MEKNNRRLYSGFTSLAFVIFGIYLIFTSNQYSLNPNIILTIGVLTILFFLSVAVIVLKDFFKNKKG